MINVQRAEEEVQGSWNLQHVRQPLHSPGPVPPIYRFLSSAVCTNPSQQASIPSVLLYKYFPCSALSWKMLGRQKNQRISALRQVRSNCLAKFRYSINISARPKRLSPVLRVNPGQTVSTHPVPRQPLSSTRFHTVHQFPDLLFSRLIGLSSGLCPLGWNCQPSLAPAFQTRVLQRIL